MDVNPELHAEDSGAQENPPTCDSRMGDNDADVKENSHENNDWFHILNHQEETEFPINESPSDNRRVTVYSVLHCIERAHCCSVMEYTDDQKSVSGNSDTNEEQKDEKSSIVLNQIPEKKNGEKKRHSGKWIEDISRTSNGQQELMNIEELESEVVIPNETPAQSTDAVDSASSEGSYCEKFKYNLRKRSRTVPLYARDNQSEDDRSGKEYSDSDSVLSEDTDGSEDSWIVSNRNNNKIDKSDGRLRPIKKKHFSADVTTKFGELFEWNAFHMCPVCKKMLKTREQFFNHFTTHGSCRTYFVDSDNDHCVSYYRCKPCNYTKRNFKDFKEHIMKQCHGPNGYVSFPLHMSISASGDLPTPPENFRPGYKCKICEKVFFRRDQVLSHVQKHKEKEKSERTLDSNTAFVELVKWNAFHVCPVCKKMLTSREEFTEHFTINDTCRTYFLDNDGETYICKPCEYTERDFGVFRDHIMNTCHGPDGYASVPLDMAVAEELSYPALGVRPGYQCQICGSVSHSRGKALLHVQTHGKDDVNNTRASNSKKAIERCKKATPSTSGAIFFSVDSEFVDKKLEGNSGSREPVEIISESDESDEPETMSSLPRHLDSKTVANFFKWNAQHLCPVCKSSQTNRVNFVKHFSGDSPCKKYFLDNDGITYTCRPCNYSKTSFRVFIVHLIRESHGAMGYVSFPLEPHGQARACSDDVLGYTRGAFRPGYSCLLCGDIRHRIDKGLIHLQESHTKKYVETWVAFAKDSMKSEKLDECKVLFRSAENFDKICLKQNHSSIQNNTDTDLQRESEADSAAETSTKHKDRQEMKCDYSGKRRSSRKPTLQNVIFDELMKWNSSHVCPVCETFSENDVQFRQHFSMSPNCKNHFRDSLGRGFTCKPCDHTDVYFTRFWNHLVMRNHGALGRVSFPVASRSVPSTKTDFTGHSLSRLGTEHDEQPIAEYQKNANANMTIEQTTDGVIVENLLPDIDKKINGEEGYRNTFRTAVEDKSSTFEPGFCCQICGSVLETRERALHHLNTIHYDSFMDFKPLQCPLCKERYTSKLALTEHMECQGDAHSKCDECRKWFSSVNMRDIHIKETHTNDTKNTMCTRQKKFKCGLCGKMLATRILFVEHERIHSGEKPYVCDSCGLNFHRKNGFKRHMFLHQRIPCSICDQLVDKRDLKRHKKLHVPTRPFGCDQCGKMFKQIHHLTNHLLSHTNTRAFKCYICGYAFNMKHHMESHIGTKHGVKEADLKNDVPSKATENMSTTRMKRGKTDKTRKDKLR